MKPEEIKYHAPKADAAIEKLGLHDASSAAEVASCMFLTRVLELSLTFRDACQREEKGCMSLAVDSSSLM